MPVLEVISPHPLVLAAIGIVEGAVTVSESQAPVAHVAIAEEFVVPVGSLEPDVSAEATLVVVLPVSRVLLIRGEPVHGALAVTLVDAPLTLIVVARLVSHAALPTFHALFPVSVID